MKNRIYFADCKGGRDFFRSIAEKVGNDFRQHHHLLIISINALRNLRSGGHFRSLVEYDGDLRSIADQGWGGCHEGRVPATADAFRDCETTLNLSLMTDSSGFG